jgi:hypothetical protein
MFGGNELDRAVKKLLFQEVETIHTGSGHGKQLKNSCIENQEWEMRIALVSGSIASNRAQKE